MKKWIKKLLRLTGIDKSLSDKDRDLLERLNTRIAGASLVTLVGLQAYAAARHAGEATSTAGGKPIGDFIPNVENQSDDQLLIVAQDHGLKTAIGEAVLDLFATTKSPVKAAKEVQHIFKLINRSRQT